jgi:nicotinate-nucleotide adenylyltransferase
VKRIALYGGTFDPIHYAHLILARDALEKLQLDELIFVPAAVSPHKIGSRATDGRIRLEMINAAIAGEAGFRVDDCELLRQPPSYTIDTVEEFQARENNAKLFYLIGEDNVAGLNTWHRCTELTQTVEFVVLDRTGLHAKHDFQCVRRHVDISATDIRNRVASGRSIRYLVPPEVEELIRRHELYREPQHNA